MRRISYQDVPSAMFEKLRDLETFIAQSSLSEQLLELMRLRVSQLNLCAYCVDMHHKELKHLGESDLRLSMLCVWRETSLFSEKEQVVLTFAETLSKGTRKNLPDAVYDPLTSFFSKEEICYLTLAVAQINTWNKLMKTFQFESGKYQVEGAV